MKTATLQTRSFILTAAIGGLVLVYAFLVFLPTSRAIARMRSKLDDRRKFIVATQKDYTSIGAIQTDLEETKASLQQRLDQMEADMRSLAGV